MFRLHFLTVLILLLVPHLAAADVLTVRQDGTGDFTTIGAAVAAASANDVIEVGPGTYAEGAAIEISMPLTLVSTDGEAATHLDGSSQHRILLVNGGDVHISGFTFENGFHPCCGGAIGATVGSATSVEECLFLGNTADSGGAIYVTASRTGIFTQLIARRCRFIGNHANTAGGAVSVMVGATGTLEDCYFEANTAVVYGGALFTYQAESHYSQNLFVRNSSGDVAGAICLAEGTGTTENNTIVDSTSPGSISGSIILLDSPNNVVQRNIIVGDTAGFGLRVHGAQSLTSHACNVFWGNADGPVGGQPLAADEIVADPNFCDASTDDYSLSSTSPATAENSPCQELLGAQPVGCVLPQPGAPRITSILDVPADNGRQVRIKWDRSGYDGPGQPQISGYGIYRREPGYVAGSGTAKAGAVDMRQPGIELDGWDYIATLPARGDASYQFVAPTLCDRRVRGGPPQQEECVSVFFVSAMTPDPLVFFDSEPDSGYSTDETPPAVLHRLQLQVISTGMELTWDIALETDVDVYRVYRGDHRDFETSEKTLVQTLNANRWVDSSPNAAGASYKVAAVDEAGNEGSAAFVAAEGTRMPLVFKLHQNHPNPFNPATQIAYDVPSGGGIVELAVFDASGRRVRTLLQGFQSEGRSKSVEWNGRTDAGLRAASGIYFYRLLAPGYEETRRMTLLQ